jgi:hypothetical protein
MDIDAFTPEEQNALLECIAALRNLSTYESPDFEASFGNSREEVEEFYAAFPNWDLYDEAASGYDPSGDVIRNAFAWLLNGPVEEKKAIYSTLSFDLKLLPHLHAKFNA